MLAFCHGPISST
jgi:glycerol-3-phosphate dehydrogenase